MTFSSRLHTRFETVEVLRGIAASAVVFHHVCWVISHYHHAASWLVNCRRLPEIGAGGVDIFFCISGVVIAQSAMRLPVGGAAAAQFLYRRVTRVYPLYWLVTTLLIALWAAHLAFAGLIVTPWLLLADYLLIPFPKTTVYGDVTLHPILDVGWTLAFEMYFYALCTAIIRWFGGQAIWPVMALALAAGAGLCIALTGTKSIAATVLASPLLLEFLAGVALAHYRDALTPDDPLTARRLGKALLLTGTAAWLLSALLPDPMAWRVVVWGLPGAMLVWGAMIAPIDPGRTAWKLPAFLGKASYSIYLAHPVATLLMGNLLKRGLGQQVSPDVLILLAWPVLVLGCAGTWPYVERPITQAAQALVTRRKFGSGAPRAVENVPMR